MAFANDLEVLVAIACARRHVQQGFGALMKTLRHVHGIRPIGRVEPGANQEWYQSRAELLGRR